MHMAGCCREAPAHGYTVWCVNGRYLAARLDPRAKGMMCGDGMRVVSSLRNGPASGSCRPRPRSGRRGGTRFSGTYGS